MTLEFEQLAEKLRELASHVADRHESRRSEVAAACARLADYSTAWDTIDDCLLRAREMADEKFFRAARPLHDDPVPFDAAIPCGEPPARATVIGADGSQILPDRHAPFLYYLINVGGLIYHHGDGRSPTPFSHADLNFPRADTADDADTFVMAPGAVAVLRDLAEINALARAAWERRDDGIPRLAMLDQRLLYFPVGGDSDVPDALKQWRRAMTQVRDSGGYLAGYIDRPQKSAVATLLHCLDIDTPGFNVNALRNKNVWQRLLDADIFATLLRPGERSKVFVDVSLHNDDFAADSPDNEVCFFYLNAGGNNLARVDIPMWVARDSTAVAAVHALIFDQCSILGGYPYVLTRADEIAVVGRRDQADLDARIAWLMEQHALAFASTAKQESKNIARVQIKSRHAL